MPNQRGRRQTIISLPVDLLLLAEIDSKRGATNRSQFIRDAVYEKLRAMGIPLPRGLASAPDRVKQRLGNMEQSMGFNEQPHSEPAPAGKKAKYKAKRKLP